MRRPSCAFRSAGRPGWRRLRRQRVGVEQPDFLPDPVFLDREIFLLEVLDGITAEVDDPDVDRDQRRPAADGRRRLLAMEGRFENRHFPVTKPPIPS